MIDINPTQLCVAYGLLNLLVVFAYGALRLGHRWRGFTLGDAPSLARAGRWILEATLLLPLAILLPQGGLLEPLSPQVFEALPMGARGGPAASGPAALLAPVAAEVGSHLGGDFYQWLLGMIGISCLGMAGRLAWAWWGLSGLLRRGHPIASVGQVRVLVSPEATVPFSAWLPGRSWVVLPESSFGVGEEPDVWRVALSHELQHHRQGDTRWLYALALLRALCVLNPFAHGFTRISRELAELRCDHALLSRGLSPGRYARSLCQVAELVITTPSSNTLVCATLGGGAGSLRRRILLMTQHRPTSSPSRRGLWLGLACLPLLGGLTLMAGSSAHALNGDVATVAAKSAESGGFPISVNAQVESVLHRMTIDPKWTGHMSRGLERLPELKPQLEPILVKAGLPTELVAIVLVESGGVNFDASATGGSLALGPRGAGLWMFIPDTARAYGLQVDETVDERLDIPKETQAAADLLGDLYARFGDWTLALAAYNQGSGHVKQAIKAGGSDDPWALMERGLINDYAARINAAMIIMAEPSLIGN